MTKEELRKSLDFVNEERERLQRENEDLRGAIADYQEAVGDYQDEIVRKDNIINNITKYVRTFKTDEITTRELCILNDILLITEEKENIVARLKEKSGE